MQLMIFSYLLNKSKVDKINLEKLRSHQTDMVDNAMKEGWEDRHLQEKFVGLFNDAGSLVGRDL